MSLSKPQKQTSQFSHTSKSIFHRSLNGMSELYTATRLSSQVAQPSVTARSIITSFTEKLLANRTIGPLERLYLIGILLSDSILFRPRNINVILGYFKGRERDLSGR